MPLLPPRKNFRPTLRRGFSSPSRGAGDPPATRAFEAAASWRSWRAEPALGPEARLEGPKSGGRILVLRRVANSMQRTSVQTPWNDSRSISPAKTGKNKGFNHGFKVVRNGFRVHPQYRNPEKDVRDAARILGTQGWVWELCRARFPPRLQVACGSCV